MQTFPSAEAIYHASKFETLLLSFYQNILPPLKKELESRFSEEMNASIIKNDIQRQLLIISSSIMACFRLMVTFCCLEPLLNAKIDKESKSKLIHDFLDLITTATSFASFTRAYFTKYPFETDLSLLIETDSETTEFVDQNKVDSLLCIIAMHLNEKLNQKEGGLEEVIANPFNKENQMTIDNNEMTRRNQLSEISVANTPKLEEASRTMDEVQLESYISSVTDILPDLGVGFIEECLLYYNYQVEKVVDALLTDSLPQCLEKLDISMPRKAKQAHLQLFIKS